MDKTLLKTKFMDIYFSTLQIGVGVFFVPDHKTLHITLLVIELCFYFGRWQKMGMTIENVANTLTKSLENEIKRTGEDT